MYHRKRLAGWQIPATITLLFLGIMVSVQFRTQQNLLSSLYAMETDDLVTMWKSLNEKRTNLQQEITTLQAKFSLMRQESLAGETNLSSIRTEMDHLRLLNGTAPVKGPGISLTITGDAPLFYYDLVDIVNELWASGAEAVAINNQRITASTSISEGEANNAFFITVNGKKLLYPAVVKAIGDPQTLEKSLTFDGGLIDNLNTLQIYPQIIQREEIFLPAASEPASLKYVRAKTPSTS
ncbi:MAG: DUF881 domain-containing protein [Bacillota bacterium]